MAKEKHVLIARVDEETFEKLREISYLSKTSIAKITEEALKDYIKKRGSHEKK
jgi:predicted transcriptional regulator